MSCSFCYGNIGYKVYEGGGQNYRKVASSNTSRLEDKHMMAFSNCLWIGIIDPYVLWPFDKKLIYKLVTQTSTSDSKVDRFLAKNQGGTFINDVPY